MARELDRRLRALEAKAPTFQDARDAPTWVLFDIVAREAERTLANHRAGAPLAPLEAAEWRAFAADVTDTDEESLKALSLEETIRAALSELHASLGAAIRSRQG